VNVIFRTLISHRVNPQPIARRGDCQIDQFKLEPLPAMVIYEPDGMARIGFGHYFLLTPALRLRQNRYGGMSAGGALSLPPASHGRALLFWGCFSFRLPS